MKNLAETIKILNHIKDNPSATQRELVKELNVSLGKVNFIINALVDKGLIKLQRFKNSKRKKGYVYLLTPKGIREKAGITKRFLAEKTEEYNKIKAQIAELKSQIE